MRYGYMLFVALSAVCAALLPQTALGQSLNEIETSGRYYYGKSGTHSTLQDADNEAMRLLLTSISTNVVVDVGTSHHGKVNNGVYSENKEFRSTVMSYSYGHLTNVGQLQFGKAPEIGVVRYILKSDVDRIFDGRRDKIYAMIDNADMALSKGKVDVALRNYNWAYSLVNSLPYPSEEKCGSLNLSTWLPSRIEEILNDIRVAVVEKRDLEAELYFTYKGKPVTSLDFTYNDMGHENSYTAKDGMGMIELTPYSDSTLYNISIEYAFAGQAMLDPEVEAVMRLQKGNLFTAASMTARPGGQFNKPVPQELIQPTETNADPNHAEVKPLNERESFTFAENPEEVRPATLQDPDVLKHCNDVLDAIVRSVVKKDYDVDPQYFTPDGLDEYKALIRYGRAKVVGTPKFSFSEFNDLIIGRGVQMAFSFKSGVHRNFVEDLVFTMTRDGHVCNIAFGLGKTVEDNIMCQVDIPEESRKYLCRFIENYQTAYALKDLDYISRIFDEYAKIITVTVVPRVSRGLDGATTFKKELIQHRFNNKYDFLKKLKVGFESKEFINLRFNSVTVDQAEDKREIYGIQLEQDYYSSNYCDHGYLLIGLNYENKEEPSIFVRAWQPEPDPNFGLYKLPDFYKGDGGKK